MATSPGLVIVGFTARVRVGQSIPERLDDGFNMIDDEPFAASFVQAAAVVAESKLQPATGPSREWGLYGSLGCPNANNLGVGTGPRSSPGEAIDDVGHEDDPSVCHEQPSSDGPVALAPVGPRLEQDVLA